LSHYLLSLKSLFAITYVLTLLSRAPDSITAALNALKALKALKAAGSGKMPPTYDLNGRRVKKAGVSSIATPNVSCLYCLSCGGRMFANQL